MGSKPLHRNFKGHLGRLSAEQEAALATFKTNLEEAGLYTPATASTNASHDNATVLRFLRARRFDPAKAQKQFSDRITWEEKHNVHNLFANFPTEEFENSRRYYPRWTGRRDRQGLPVYVYRLNALSSNIQEEITAVPPERRYERIVVLYEAMTRFVAPLCTHLPHEIAPTPIVSVTTIIDLTDVSLRQMWTLRNHLQEASVLANANYPETLGTVIVVNAPSFFSTVWGWIKGWFDEYTREKIHILGSLKSADSGNSKELAALIAPADLPRAYGGELEWEFFDGPALDDEARKAIGKMPKGPWIFEDGEIRRPKEYEGVNGEHQVPDDTPAIASGNEGGETKGDADGPKNAEDLKQIVEPGTAPSRIVEVTAAGEERKPVVAQKWDVTVES